MHVENAAAIDVRIPLGIAKVDKAARTVEGIATQEVQDVHGQIVDHESMKAVLADWPGNIREMHQPIAVGKALKVESDDEKKATIVRSRISKGAPDTWEKVLDGTLSMYSIGGKGVVKTVKNAAGEEEQRIFMTSLHEISLVDNGACPTAKFDIVKSVDGASIECQPEEPAEVQHALLGLNVTRFVTAGGALAQLVTKAIAAAAGEVDVEKRNYPAVWQIEQTLCAIACLERLAAEEWWKAESGDATETDRTQLEVLKNAVELVLSYLMSEFSAQFEKPAEGEVTNVARIAALVDQAAFNLPVTFGKLTGSGELLIAKAGARHSKTDMAMLQQMHDTAISLGAACKAQECEACKLAKDAAAEKPAETPAEPATAPAVPAGPDTTEKASPAGQEPPQDATAQPTEGQEGQPAAAAPAAPAPATPAVPVQAAAGLPGTEVLNIVKAAVAEALAAQEATHKTAIAELTARVEKLSNEPVSGGPKARATSEGIPVHKSLGNGAAAADLSAFDPSVVTTFAAQLSAEAKTEDERLRIATNLLKFQHSTGNGAVAIRQTTGRPRAIETPDAGQ